MKKWLRIILLITCLVGVTSLLGTQAQRHKKIIQSAALHDQSGRVVESLSSHQPQDVKMALTLELPVGDTAITLADQDHAKFVPGEIADLQPAEDITAKVDQQKNLVLNNSQEQAQKVKLLVPIKLTDPLLISNVQLKLLVVDKAQKFKLAQTKVAADTDEDAEADAEENDGKLTEEATKKEAKKVTEKATEKTADKETKKTSKKSTKQSEKVSSNDDTNTVTSNSQSKKKTTVSKRVKKNQTSSSKEDTEAAEKATAPAAKVSSASDTTDSSHNLTGAPINIHRGRIQIDSWSDELEISGQLLEDDKAAIVGPREKNTWVNTYKGNLYKYQYYYSYQQGENARASAVVFNEEPEADDSFMVYYKNVGAYTTSSESEELDQQMGAIVKFSNIVYSHHIPGGTDGATKGDRYIDLSNNFYSGTLYNGIKEFYMDVTFTDETGQRPLNFPELEGNDDYKSVFTFGSLNGNERRYEWAGTRSGLKGILADGAMITEHDDGWYQGTGIGVWEKNQPYTGPNQWGDFLGSTNYELGAVSFPMVGETQLFKVRSDDGFTWQSFSSGYVVPLEPRAPQKTVHRTDDFGPSYNDLNGKTINRDTDDLSKFYYTIYQPTYRIPDASIAKPKKIMFEDQLPAGVTVKEENIRLRNTNGDVITDGGKATISPEGKLTYTLSDKEIEDLTFNGDSFVLQLEVTFDDDFVGTFKNRAQVTFDSGGTYIWPKSTNEVVTHFERDTYRFRKVDGTTGKGLANAEFVVKNNEGKYLTFDDNGWMKALVDDEGQATKLKSDDNGNFKAMGLPNGDYQLIETKVPDGYVGGAAHNFTVSDEGQATLDKIENDPEYSLPITGGHGIIWFIIVGLMLTLSALAIWRKHPRGG